MRWASMISYLPIQYAIPLAQIKNQTQKVVFESNLTGNQVRVRFSNKYSQSPLELYRVTIGKLYDETVAGVREITRENNSVIVLAPGEECYSDIIEYPVSTGDCLALSIYVKKEQTVESVCAFWSKTGAQVHLGENGDYTDGRIFTETPAENVYEVIRTDANKGMFFYGFTGVQVLTEDQQKTIAAFGDSITHMAYVTNAVFHRLCMDYPGQATLLNCGIGGNRLLHDATPVKEMPGGGSCFGEAGLKRFETDVFGEERVDAVFLLEGINDIMHPVQFDIPEQTVTASELIDGYIKIAACIHRHGARAFCATLPPCGNPEYPKEWMEIFEQIRCDLNDWIRNNQEYDGYFDYDRAAADAQRPEYMKVRYHLGDGLHPNDEGGAAMAAEIDFDRILQI